MVNIWFFIAHLNLTQFIHTPLSHQILSYILLPNQHRNRPALHNNGSWNMATQLVNLPVFLTCDSSSLSCRFYKVEYSKVNPTSTICGIHKKLGFVPQPNLPCLEDPFKFSFPRLKIHRLLWC